MKNKKSISFISAFLILFFHLWINLSNTSGAEVFIKQTAYIGVDMFFFISGFSLAKHPVNNYLKYIQNRFFNIYLKYILFAVVAFIYSGWSVLRLLKVVCGIELWTKGGGSFLWFVPAIMIFYLLFPIIDRFDSQNRLYTFLAVTVIWIVVAASVTYFTGYTKIFIFWNRIPVFMLGYYASKCEYSLKDKKILQQVITAVVLLTLGYAIIYAGAYKTKLQIPFTEMFYVLVIPATLGLVMLSGMIPEVKVIKWLGSSTLEMYAIQMIFGYKIANYFLMKINNKLITNLIVFIIIMLASVLIHYGLDAVIKKLKYYLLKMERDNGKTV